MIRILAASLKPPVITLDSLELGLVKRLGFKDGCITRPETRRGFQKIFRSKFLNRLNPDKWRYKRGLSSLEAAKGEVKRRLAAYEKPPIGPRLETEAAAYAKKSSSLTERGGLSLHRERAGQRSPSPFLA